MIFRRRNTRQIPNADVRASRHEGHPVDVTVSLLHTEDVDDKKTAEDWLNAPKTEIFMCQQRLLFGKYPRERSASMANIEQAVLAAISSEEAKGQSAA